MRICEIRYSWHNSHISKNAVMVTKLTRKSNSCQDHKIDLTGCIFIVAETAPESSLNPWLLPIHSPGQTHHPNASCLHSSSVLWQITSEFSVKNSKVSAEGHQLLSSSRSYLLSSTRTNEIARGIWFSPSQSILQVNSCWKDSKPLGTCRYAPKTLWGT